jgi:hypothetical protein
MQYLSRKEARRTCIFESAILPPFGAALRAPLESKLRFIETAVGRLYFAPPKTKDSLRSYLLAKTAAQINIFL